MNHKINQWLQIILPIAGIMLLLGMLPIFPYAYYQFLRWLTTIAALLLISKYLKTERKSLVIVSSLIAIAFNPIAPIYLERGIWMLIDLVVAIFFLVLKRESEIIHKNKE